MSKPLQGGPLQAGKRRRHWAKALAVVLLLLAPIAVGAAAAYVLLSREDRRAGVPVASGGPAGSSALVSQTPKTPVPPAAPAVRLQGVDAFRLHFRRQPRAALLFDLSTGDVLWRRQALRRLPVASLTKIMTAIMVVERTKPREQVRIGPSTRKYEGSGVGLLPQGRKVPVESVLHGMLLVSGNDAAIALAGHVWGSERRFVRAMNRRAKRLGLRCTRFASSHGLQRGNGSCAADLAVLTRLAMRERRIRRIVRKRQSNLRFPVKGGRLSLYTTNPLVRSSFRGAIGLKTGYTRSAGRCLVAVARRRGRMLAAVLLDSPDPGKQAAKMLDVGFRRSR
ncbi:MAG: serine hydrolase [Actinomycetota bacterium]|nr:serine hydrolase [Actinomycetota bacterium]